MNKYIFTFGSGQLEDFDVRCLDSLGSMYIALVIEADTENEARNIVFNTKGIGSKFCTSYPYSEMENLRVKWGMSEFTLDQLEEVRIK